MQVTVLGFNKREKKEENGRTTVFTTIYYSQPFDEYTLQNQVCYGETCGSVNTSLTVDIHVGDVINLDYAPSGFTSSDGTPRFRLQSIQVVKAAENPFNKEKADKK